MRGGGADSLRLKGLEDFEFVGKHCRETGDKRFRGGKTITARSDVADFTKTPYTQPESEDISCCSVKINWVFGRVGSMQVFTYHQASQRS